MTSGCTRIVLLKSHGKAVMIYAKINKVRRSTDCAIEERGPDSMALRSGYAALGCHRLPSATAGRHASLWRFFVHDHPPHPENGRPPLAAHCPAGDRV